MNVTIAALTMLILPLLIASVLIGRSCDPSVGWADLIGFWFVFLAVGLRLGIAVLRQLVRPEFNAKDIFGLEGSGALVIVRELCFANLALGIVGVLTLLSPTFVLPAALYACIFYIAAEAMHVMEAKRDPNESVA
jgi:hypothetical protein